MGKELERGDILVRLFFCWKTGDDELLVSTIDL
jgi:hypothetical protein